MGAGARVVIFNVSSHAVTLSTTLEDWIKEKSKLSGTLAPRTTIDAGYFEYANLHTGHIGIAAAIEGSKDQCMLVIADMDIDQRTSGRTPALWMEYAKSELNGVTTFSMALYDPPRGS